MPKANLIGDKDVYEVLEEIGHGAYATVFRGRRMANNQTVAIKKMKGLTKTVNELLFRR